MVRIKANNQFLLLCLNGVLAFRCRACLAIIVYGHHAGQVLLPGHRDVHQACDEYANHNVFAAAQTIKDICYRPGRGSHFSQGVLTTGRRWTSSVIAGQGTHAFAI
jgi:hypothetical protein